MDTIFQNKKWNLTLTWYLTTHTDWVVLRVSPEQTARINICSSQDPLVKKRISFLSFALRWVINVQVMLFLIKQVFPPQRLQSLGLYFFILVVLLPSWTEEDKCNWEDQRSLEHENWKRMLFFLKLTLFICFSGFIFPSHIFKHPSGSVTTSLVLLPSKV